MYLVCRTPRGVRGLKRYLVTMSKNFALSHPTWGAWIETGVASLMNGIIGSHPTWGAWIETALLKINIRLIIVAPHVGCVD